MTRIFSLLDAGDIASAPYVARAFAGERARRAAHAREAAAAAGKSLHLDPCRPRPPAALEAEGIAAWRRAVAFAASARGRLLQALAALADGFPGPAQAALAAYTRGLTDPAATATAEVGRALTALGALDGAAAHTARLALLDILAETLRLAATDPPPSAEAGRSPG